MRPRRDARARRRANRAGRRAERLAALWLLLKGYRLMALGFTVSGGEIDIVARRGGTIAFVEVKARAARDTALLAVDAATRRRLSRAAKVWLTRHPAAMAMTLRGDAVVLAPWRLPSHVPDAFPLDIGW